MHTETAKTKTATDYQGDNPFQAINRYKKARKIVDHLRQLGVTAVTPEPTQETLVLIGNGLGLASPPSLTTWALAAYLLTEED